MLKTLAEHNSQARTRYYANRLVVRNGIACPKCGSELYDNEPNVTLTTDPPETRVKCTKCDYQGMRVC